MYSLIEMRIGVTSKVYVVFIDGFVQLKRTFYAESEEVLIVYHVYLDHLHSVLVLTVLCIHGIYAFKAFCK